MSSLFAKIIDGPHEYFLKVRKVLEQKTTKYQEVLIAEIDDHGKTLILDNELQTCYVDVVPYHEAMVHFYTPKPEERVLVLGSGEGLSVDILIRRGWENIDAVEIDEEACEMYDKHLSDWNHNIYKRQDEFNMIFDDGLEVLKATPDQYYSYVIFDLDSKSILENQKEWITEIHRVLHHNGLLTCQDGENTGLSYFDKTVREVFGTIPERKGLLDWSWLHTPKKPIL